MSPKKPERISEFAILRLPRCTHAGECWDLWKRRQELAGARIDFERARLAIETHLQRIEQHRPLEKIEQEDRRKSATQVRRWFREDFLNAIPD